jgi:hypothetical protein
MLPWFFARKRGKAFPHPFWVSYRGATDVTNSVGGQVPWHKTSHLCQGWTRRGRVVIPLCENTWRTSTWKTPFPTDTLISWSDRCIFSERKSARWKRLVDYQLTTVGRKSQNLSRGVIKSWSDGNIQSCRFYLDDESSHRREDYGNTVSLRVWRNDGNKSLDDF